MPRLLQSVVTKAARNFNPYLSLLLKETRTIESAENELRWLKEHVQSLRNESSNSPIRALEKDAIGSHMTKPHISEPEDRLLDLCRRRAKGEPLQYILGSQPFGDLDIKCEPGVLIPR
jgi:methylase of polypeptide subunit release factors